MRSPVMLHAVTIPGMLFLVSLIIPSCSEVRTIPEDKINMKRMDLTGDVKSVTETVCRCKMDSEMMKAGDTLSRTLYAFNRRGQITVRKDYDRENSVRGRVSYKTDRQRRIIEKAGYDYSGQLENRDTYSYNRKENSIEKTSFRPPARDWVISVYYDEKGNLKKGSYHRLVKEQRWKTVFKYDDKGNLAEELFYGTDTIVSSRRLYRYDSNDKLIVSELFNNRGELILKETFSYDENGLLSGKIGTSPGESILTAASYKYDETGRLSEEIFNYGSTVSTTRYIYGNFDNHGNWREKTETYSSEKNAEGTMVVTLRDIVYFKGN